VLLEPLLLNVQLSGLGESERQADLHVLDLVGPVGQGRGLVVLGGLVGLLHRDVVTLDLIGHAVLLSHVVTLYLLVFLAWIDLV